MWFTLFLLIAAIFVGCSQVGIMNRQVEQDRPWMIVQPRFPNKLPQAHIIVRWLLVNGGRSPAFVTSRGAAVEEFQGGLPKEPDYGKPPRPMDEIVVPADGRIRHGSFCPMGSIRWSRIVKGESKVVFYGRVVYLDAFRREHIHAFCYEFVPFDTFITEYRKPDDIKELEGYWLSTGGRAWTINT